jgi:hypothetical protein
MHRSVPAQTKKVLRGRMAVLLLCLTAMSGFGHEREVASANPKIDQRATDALRRMGAQLRALKSFEVNAQTLRDEVLDDGETVQVSGVVDYLVRVPDRLRADVRTDRKQRQIIYDGKTLTVYAPRMKYYAAVPAPSTIGATLDTARKRLGIEFPLADLFLWGTSRDGMSELTSARYVGPAYINGIDTDQYAFRQPGTDWQIWIDRGKNPLPRKVVITSVGNAARPQYVATLTWNFKPITTDAPFVFTPPKNVGRIVFASLASTSVNSAENK